MDSTGLKISGEDDWTRNKDKTKTKRKKWGKLHLGLDLLSSESIRADLTLDNNGDPSALTGLPGQVDGHGIRFLADGVYNGSATSDLLKACFRDAVEIIIPAPKNAIFSPQSVHDPSSRDEHIAEIQIHGRLAWQVSSGHNQRNRGETRIGRWKGVIGSNLKARSFENQKTEVRTGVSVLTKMTGFDRPELEPVT